MLTVWGAMKTGVREAVFEVSEKVMFSLRQPDPGQCCVVGGLPALTVIASNRMCLLNLCFCCTPPSVSVVEPPGTSWGGVDYS